MGSTGGTNANDGDVSGDPGASDNEDSHRDVNDGSDKDKEMDVYVNGEELTNVLVEGEHGEPSVATSIDMDEVSDDEDLSGIPAINLSKELYPSEMKRTFMFCLSERRKPKVLTELMEKHV